MNDTPHCARTRRRTLASRLAQQAAPKLNSCICASAINDSASSLSPSYATRNQLRRQPDRDRFTAVPWLSRLSFLSPTHHCRSIGNGAGLPGGAAAVTCRRYCPPSGCPPALPLGIWHRCRNSHTDRCVRSLHGGAFNALRPVSEQACRRPCSLPNRECALPLLQPLHLSGCPTSLPVSQSCSSQEGRRSCWLWTRT